jgi:hypothetical protein
MRIIGSKIYDVCPDCGGIVCLNKFLFGSLHVCTIPEERQKYPQQIAAYASLNRDRLNKA